MCENYKLHHHYPLLILSVLIFFIGNKSFAQDLDFMTYNIRYSIKNNPNDNWDSRKKRVVQLFNYYKPDVFGIQEGMIHQLAHIKTNLKNYDYIGVARDNGKEIGEFNAIFYDATKFKIIKQSTFWLSENNEIKKGWDAGFIRICTYALLESKTNQSKFWVFNTHLDHEGPTAREKSVDLILKNIKKLNKNSLPLVLMGDLNDTPESKSIKILKSHIQDAYEISESSVYGPKGTFNGYETDKIITQRIDYIFTSKLKVLNYRHIDDRLDDGQFISDHLPILIKTKLLQ